MTPRQHTQIAVVNFGGQYAHLIARRIRQLGVRAEVVPAETPSQALRGFKGLVLSGGPRSVHDPAAPRCAAGLLALNVPVLGLCYGHQLLALLEGGEVQSVEQGEYGRTSLRWLVPPHEQPLFAGVTDSTVWMSHGDLVQRAPTGYHVLAATAQCPVAAMAHADRPIFGLQFHPEVRDTPMGERVFANFLSLCAAQRDWDLHTHLQQILEDCRRACVGSQVLVFLSGGVDSTLTAVLLARALGQERIRGLFIDHGFMRKGEVEQIRETYAKLQLGRVDFVDASQRFFAALKGLIDPQRKRHVIGEMFLQVRQDYMRDEKLDPRTWMLGQGTLYPDVIESGGANHAEVIKLHHNRVPSIQRLLAAGQLVEPLCELYKDEVRTLGKMLGLAPEIVQRQPFPGPGLAINVLCSDGHTPHAELQRTQSAVQEVLSPSYSVRILPVRSVGVQGDQRSYALPAVLHGPLQWDALEAQAIALTNHTRLVNRVVVSLAPLRPVPLRVHPAECIPQRFELLREADHLTTQNLQRHGLYAEIFQLLVILLPLGEREDEECLVLRAVISEDVMSARFARLSWKVLLPLARRLRRLPKIRAVFYDITHKPPATFGWE